MNPLPPIPVTVLTGFLGAGKTTLLNRLLTEKHGRRIAVIENEFGEIGIDHELVVNAEEEIFEMNNGCICCTVRGDLIRILGNLVRRRDRFDYVLIETTGLADPGPVAQTFFVDEEVRASFRLDGIVTVVDALHVQRHLDDSRECQEQIAFADKILLNKVDLVGPADLDALERRLRAMNAAARIVRTRESAVPASEVVDLHAFELGAKLALDPAFLQPELPFEWSGEYSLDAGTHRLRLRAGPDPEIGVLLLPLADTSEAAWADTRERAASLFNTPGRTLAPGQSFDAGPARVLLQPAPDRESVFGVAVPSSGRFTLFTQHHPSEFGLALEVDGRALSPLRFEEHAPGHTHDASVSSVGIREAGSLDPARLNDWMGTLLREQGRDIFRMKGVLDVQGSADRVVFQGVHMLFDAKADRPWKPGEPRINQLIFIGRNLDRAELLAGFRSCRV